MGLLLQSKKCTTTRIDFSGDTMPHPWPGGQAEFAADWHHQYVALEGGWMSGKTWVGARKLMTLHLHNAFDAEGRATYVPSVIVAPTFRAAMDYDIPQLEAAAEEAGLSLEYRPSMAALVCADLGTRAKPSLIMVRSAERPDRIAGWEVGAAWGDEATRWPESRIEPKRDTYLQLQSRVRHLQARCLQLMFTYTNEGDVSRMFEEFHAGKPRFALYRAPTSENPLAEDFAEIQRESLTAELARQYLGGEAVNLRSRRCYDVFTTGLNVDASLALRSDLPLHIAVDFNISPGMHIEIGQYDETADVLTVVHEIHAHGMSLREAIVKLRDLIAGLGGWRWPGPLDVFGDATGSSQWAGTGESCYQILRQGLQDADIAYRVRVPRANPMVIDRINAMNVAMRDLRGRIHWRCHPRCKRLINDLKKVRLNEHGIIDKGNTLLSHASDAEGYRVAYLRPARVTRQKVAAGRIGFATD